MPSTEHAPRGAATSDSAPASAAPLPVTTPPTDSTSAANAAPADTAASAPYVRRLAPPAVRRAQALAVFSLLSLILLSLAWELWLAPLRPGGSWLALKALPLCLPLAGFLKNRMYTFRWVSLMVWLYFTEGVVRAWSDPYPSNALALLEVALCLVLFTASTVLIRVRLRSAPAAQTSGPAA